MGNLLNSKETRAFRTRVGDIYGYLCYFCKERFEEYTLEHLIPICRGGSGRRLDNHALACLGCNGLKSGLTVEEFCESQGLSLDFYPRRGVLKDGVSEVLPLPINYR